MSCIELLKKKSERLFAARGRWLGLGVAALMAGCANGPGASNAPAAPVPAAAPQGQGTGVLAAHPVTPATASASPRPALAPPKPVRTHDELRRQAALRLIAANPEFSYMGEVPPVLLAIPVLEVELHGDGSIRHINIVRRPGQAPETLQMAIDAIHRAAPFGDLTRLPAPWKFTEVFLFNDERRFKPRTLDD